MFNQHKGLFQIRFGFECIGGTKLQSYGKKQLWKVHHHIYPRSVEHFRAILEELSVYYVLSGYLYGASGVIDTLIDFYIRTKNTEYPSLLRQPLEGMLTLHLFEPIKACASERIHLDQIPAGLAVGGEGLMRISCDYATGIAGVLSVLHRLETLTHADFTLDEVDEV